MRLLKSLGECPPDPVQFSYFHAETKHRSGPFFDYYSLVEAYKEHRRANTLDIPQNYNEVIQEQICSQLPPELCTYQKEGDPYPVSTRITLDDVLTFTKAIIASATGNYVSREEAERRAAICTSCYLNVNVSGCGSCAGLANLVAGDRVTSQDHNLKSCGVCRCLNKLQVHMPLTVLSSHATDSRQQCYPSFCWQKKSGVNYRG